MLIGAMNHPQRDVIQEIRWIAEMQLDFVDLTLDPPAAAAWRIDPARVRRALDEHGLDIVGHTAYYLPLGSPFAAVRQAAVAELRRCIQVFAEIGAWWMNIHPDRYAPMHDRAFFIQRDLESLSELLDFGKQLSVGLMIENVPLDFNSVEELSDLLDPLPELGLHLDMGHANLRVWQNTTESILNKYGGRVRHVHLHDNKGGDADLHLPLGAGTMDWVRLVKALKASGYDGTITLEVFTPDKHYLAYSRDMLRRVWDER
jgi:sugar phosphate isomerase/epimerase